MASKSRKRRRKRRPRPDAGTAADPTSASTEAPKPIKRVDRAADREDEPPPAPWGSFPLIEICVLVGLVMLVLGFFFVSGSRGPILIATGLVLGSIGGLELSIREHFAGYRSHTAILAGVPALIVLGSLFYAGPDGLPSLARAGIGTAVFAVFALLLMRAFSKRSGGERYRFGRLTGGGSTRRR